MRQSAEQIRRSELSETLEENKQLVIAQKVQLFAHGYDEFVEDGIDVRDLIEGTAKATVVDDYPTFAKSSVVLVL